MPLILRSCFPQEQLQPPQFLPDDAVHAVVFFIQHGINAPDRCGQYSPRTFHAAADCIKFFFPCFDAVIRSPGHGGRFCKGVCRFKQQLPFCFDFFSQGIFLKERSNQIGVRLYNARTLSHCLRFLQEFLLPAQAFFQPKHIQVNGSHDLSVPEGTRRFPDDLFKEIERIRNAHQNIVEILNHFPDLVGIESGHQETDSLPVRLAVSVFFSEDPLRRVAEAFVHDLLLFLVFQYARIHGSAGIIVVFF